MRSGRPERIVPRLFAMISEWHILEFPMGDPNLSSFIWSVADLLRGDYKQSDYAKVILPSATRVRINTSAWSSADLRTPRSR